MTNLRTEVENTASNYEKIRVTKEERLAHDLNQKVFVDRSQNDQLREHLKDLEDKRQN